MIGAKLAHFEITGQLGEGGMGTVYRARDSKLGREVAIKVLPDAFTANEERLARFEREAKVLASLNHPSIAAIYEVGESQAQTSLDSATSETVHFLVMELAEGEDLSDRLQRGPIPVDEALPIARQIAQALEAAHEAGVVHRDLKPANIMLTSDGRVKVLDFGLAKAMEAGGAVEGDLSLSPTLTAQMTSAGMILGTAAYMSPEQAKGEEADRRSDIWSFGIVLWETLVGQKTFNENTVSETLAAVLKSEPNLSLLPATVPLSIRRLIERCLQKDPSQRLHDIADARLEIEAVMRGDDSAIATAAEIPTPATGPWKVIAIAASVVAIAALGSHFLPSTEAPTARQVPVSFPIPEPGGWIDGRGPSSALSPDGTQLVYLGKEAGQPFPSGLFRRDLATVEPTPIPGTQQALGPFFSPDGSRLGFVDIEGLHVVSLAGGAPTRISAEISNYRGATWADDDSIWYSPDTEEGLWRMSPDGSNPTPMTNPDVERGERSHRWPTVLPGSDVVLFTVATSDIESFDQARIDAFRVSTGERKTVVQGGSFPLWVEPSYLIYAYSGTLMATRFNAETLETEGVAVPVYEGVKTTPLSGGAAAAVSGEGSIVVGLGSVGFENRRIRIYDRNGNAESATEEVRPYQGVGVSPDGKTLAVDVDAANAAIWLLDLERGIQTRLTREWSHNIPVWSPDGRRIITSTSRGGTYVLQRYDLDSGASEIIVESPVNQMFAFSWTDDDRVFASVAPQGASSQIWSIPLDDPDNPTVLVEGDYVNWNAQVSPDGKWVAFAGTESDRLEVYVVSSTGEGRQTRVSSDGGWGPQWSRDGTELYFISGDPAAPDKQIMAAKVTSGDRLTFGRPVAQFDVPFLYPGNVAFDVDAAGRFYVVEFILEQTDFGADLVLTRHWVEMLRDKLGN